MDKGPFYSSAVSFEEPILVARAIGTGVVKKDKQWLHGEKR